MNLIDMSKSEKADILEACLEV